jgi:hypothetical protein
MSNFLQGARKWISTSEASESDLPLPEQRLPANWDENDVIVDEDVATVSSPKKQAQQQKTAAAASKTDAAAPSPKKAAAAVAPTPAAVKDAGSPGRFPEGFFASPKNKNAPSEFPATAASPAKFSQKDEDARLKTNAAPGLLAKITGFFMPAKDGSAPSVKKPVAVAATTQSASPVKLTGARRDREESSESSSEESETSGGDLATRLTSFSAKQLESKVTVDELKEYARENDLKFTAKSKKGELIELCKNFAKKNAAAPTGAASPAATGASPRASSAVKPPAKPVAASPVAAPKPQRKAPTQAQLQSIPPVTIDVKGEPQPEWAVTQLKEWARVNKVDLKNSFLKIDIYNLCVEAYDKTH